MKLFKILVTILFLFFSSYVISKEYKTIYQFSINIPENYIGVNEFNMTDVSEILKSETDINISEWNSLLEETGIQNAEFFYNTNDLEKLNDSFVNNINIVSSKSPYYSVSKNDLIEFCPEYENYLTTLANNKVTQLLCNISSNPSIKGNSIYMEHIGVLPGILTLQYLFWINNTDMIGVTLTCDFNDCSEDRVVFNNIVSSIK